MMTNRHYGRLMFFNLNLWTSANFNKIEDIDHAFVGANHKLTAIFVGIVTADVLPMLSPHIDGRFAYVPQAQHLSAPVDELVGVLCEPDCLCCCGGSDYGLY